MTESHSRVSLLCKSMNGILALTAVLFLSTCMAFQISTYGSIKRHYDGMKYDMRISGYVSRKLKAVDSSRSVQVVHFGKYDTKALALYKDPGTAELIYWFDGWVMDVNIYIKKLDELGEADGTKVFRSSQVDFGVDEEMGVVQWSADGRWNSYCMRSDAGALYRR